MWKGDVETKRICSTVGELKAALSNIDENMELEIGFSSEVEIQIFTNMFDESVKQLVIEEHD